jgi:hypothetical protein
LEQFAAIALYRRRSGSKAGIFMRKFLLGAAAALLTVVAVVPTAEAQIYVWGGRNYCWYYDGWHGPGYYWCGYRFRRGFGWGGGIGFHGWGGHGGGYHGGVHGGGGFHGGGHGGGGFHGGGHGGGHGAGGHGGGGGHHH